MAMTLGEVVGTTVGYAVRHERKISAKTRIEVVTEGLLTRRLQADPALSDVAIVIFDEFHERTLDGDLALALTLDAKNGLRPRSENPGDVGDARHGQALGFSLGLRRW